MLQEVIQGVNYNNLYNYVLYIAPQAHCMVVLYIGFQCIWSVSTDKEFVFTFNFKVKNTQKSGLNSQ